MSHQTFLVSNTVLNEFTTCTQLQYSGKLDISSAKKQKWTFFYRLGRIVWATGGNHPLRRWYRQITLYCPEINIDSMQLTAKDVSGDFWDYQLLVKLYKTQKIQREQLKSIVDNTIAELLFDVNQLETFTYLSCERNQEIILDPLMSFTGVDISVKLMQDSWQNWLETGLGAISPDLAPVLQKPEQLQQKINPAIYKHFVTLLKGQYTLRDLAVKMKQSLLPLSRSLLPYIQREIIGLLEVPDLQLPTTKTKNKSIVTPPKKTNPPLIACVDDSPQVGHMLETILLSHGLRLLKVEDSVQALPILIQHKPDLIFLDLVMPVASGYEICAQLRRVSIFAQTPVIILTSSDGVFDRVRAKVIGSTDFISKPIVAETVMAMICKYLQLPLFPKNG
jgi:chemotaxis family two-component system response regulator PixG